ncbi:metallophosphoesterase [Hyperthermus butylicus]|uniref:Protein phosphatase 2A n=1 Tax=Hyperthermus butylicus (strain DSM 5456 / JCM 9403 / PLM1-5) TaxID=415426 RepID=A2BJR3_HYPBU|nr:metallophosphoesterase [Hyperthermus butylicus]ABM80224.1 protein phosphatase 2A [Hyperthermus butylicus DSM 5456]
MARLLELIRDALDILSHMGPVVELGADEKVLVVGDTHGYPEATEWALRLADALGADRIVFLGDYVDRGSRGVENLELLLAKLVEEPGRLVLLRGNHESPDMNYYYGFRDEVANKLGYEILDDIWRLYTCLPYIARRGDIIMLHGGVPCRRCTGEPEDPIGMSELASRMGELYCRRDGLGPADPLVFQLLWNDPSPSIDWFSPNIRGPGTYYYGWRSWTSFLKVNNARLIIRAHEVVDAVRLTGRENVVEGLHGSYTIDQLEGKVVTVFSSLYHGMRAGAALLEADTVTFYHYPEQP